ncbi:MAG: hypothetical protein ACP5JU_02755 [Minisyncoccia bacterium]
MPRFFKEKPLKKTTLEVLGKDFDRICEKWKIKEELREKLKKLIKLWDETMKIKDMIERTIKKLEIATDIIKEIDEKERGNFISCLEELMDEFYKKAVTH